MMDTPVPELAVQQINPVITPMPFIHSDIALPHDDSNGNADSAVEEVDVALPHDDSSGNADSAVGEVDIALPHDDSSGDEDSAIGEISRPTTSDTLNSQWTGSIKRHNRTYHSFKGGKYVLPNDEDEQDRLEMQHELWNITLSGKLYLAPIPRTLRVLDVGTGTGSWAISFGDDFEHAHVIGTDLSPIQGPFVPPNVQFYIDDMEEENWTFSKLTYVHWRMLFACFKSPANVFRLAYKSMDPDGIIEVQDAIMPFQGFDASFDNTDLKRWIERLIDSAKGQGLDWTCTSQYQAYMEAAGFVDVVQQTFQWPINTWQRGERNKKLGLYCMNILLRGVEAFSLELLTRSGMSVEEIQLMLVNVRKDIKNTAIHAYINIVVIYGRKPGLGDI